MKCLLRIGYSEEILLPDHKEAAKLLDILSKGMLVERDYGLHRETVTIRGELEIQLHMLPASARIVATLEMEEKAEELFREKKASKVKALPNKQKQLPYKG